jgi:hypothetical protein
VFQTIGHTSAASDAHMLLEWLLDQDRAVSAREILRNGPNRLRDKARRDAAITKLADHGLIRRETIDAAERLVVNPKVRTHE